MTPHELFEDRVPRDGFVIPEIGARFRLMSGMRLGSAVRVDIPAGTTGTVECIREPLKPCHGYVGCGITLDHAGFKKLYHSSMIVPWDEISDPTRFRFLTTTEQEGEDMQPTDDAPEGFFHAWYSETQVYYTGSSIYMSQDGKDEVEITQVGRGVNDGPQWDDTQYLGIVADKWIRKQRQSLEINKNLACFRSWSSPAFSASPAEPKT